MSFYTYVLYSECFDKTYVGFTADLSLRLQFHNCNLNSGWTKRYQPWEVLYFEEFSDKSTAMTREQQLKSYQGRQFIRQLVENKKFLGHQ